MTNPLPAAPESAGASPGALEALTSDLGGVLDSLEQLSEYLERVVHAVRRHVDGCDEVGVTILSAGRPHTAAYTTVQTLEIDAVQYALGDGPCLDAARQPSREPGRRPRQRPPVARVRARVPGGGDAQPARRSRWSAARSASAPSTSTAGDPGAFDDFDASLVRLAASRCADAVVAVSALDGVRRLAGQLEQAMASRAVIEQAKGIIMAMRGVPEHEAFEVLRKSSQDRNVKVRVLAQQIITGVVDRKGPGPA